MINHSASRSFLTGTFLFGLIFDTVSFFLLVKSNVPWFYAQLFSFAIAAIPISLICVFQSRDRGVVRSLFLSIIIQILTLYLRGGLLAILIDSHNVPLYLSVPVTIVLTHLIALYGINSWIFRSESGDGESFVWRRYILGSLIIYAIALRVVYSVSLELIHEEAYYWNYAKHLDIGYFDHPPMVAWLIWLFTSLLGNNEFAVRLGALISWAVAAVFMYKLAEESTNKESAKRMLLLLATLPAFLGTGFFMTPDAPLVACWAAAIYFYKGALVDKKKAAWYGVGVAMGLGMLSKYTIGLLALPVLSFMILDKDSRKWFLRPEPYIATIIGVIIFSPVIYWNATQDWSSFSYQSTRRFSGEFRFSLHLLILSFLLLFMPTGTVMAFALLKWRKRILPEYKASQAERSYRFLMMTTFLPLAFFALFSLTREVKLNWTVPVWLGVLPYFASATIQRSSLRQQEDGVSPKWVRWAISSWSGMIIFFIILLGWAMYYLVLSLPGLPINFTSGNTLNVAKADYALLIGEAQEEFARQHNGELPMIVCMDKDQLAGWVAFYRTKAAEDEGRSDARSYTDDVTGGQLIGKDSRQYNIWHPVSMFTSGKVVMLVDFKRRQFKNKKITKLYNPLGPVVEFVPHKRGKPDNPFYYQFVMLK